MRILCLRSSIFHIFFNVSIDFLIESEFYSITTYSFDCSNCSLRECVSFNIKLSSQATVTKNFYQLISRNVTSFNKVIQTYLCQVLSFSKSLNGIQVDGFIFYTIDIFKAINLDTIQKLAEAKNLQTVSVNDFIAAGFISASQLVKVLGNGTLTAKLDVQAHAFSKTAVAAIEAAGGQVVKL